MKINVTRELVIDSGFVRVLTHDTCIKLIVEDEHKNIYIDLSPTGAEILSKFLANSQSELEYNLYKDVGDK
jgi:hypothetical protein